MQQHLKNKWMELAKVQIPRLVSRRQILQLDIEAGIAEIALDGDSDECDQ